MAALTAKVRSHLLLTTSSALGLLGTAGVALGMALEPRRALYSYLTAFCAVTSVCVGALFVLMIGYAANARWMSVIRRLLEAVSLGVIPLAVLFVPIALGLPQIYAWAGPITAFDGDMRALIEHKRPYLAPGFFIVRTAVYFLIWVSIALVLRRLGRRHVTDPTSIADPEAALGTERALSSAALVPASLAITFAAFDWMMSLEPAWFSTMFGVYYFAGGFVAANGLVALLAYGGLRNGALAGGITHHHFHALGRMLLAFTIFWAYVAYFQLFLIRIADKPSEVAYFVPRVSGTWTILYYGLMIGHFAMPFLLLLPQRIKHRGGYTASLGALLLVAHYADVYWLVMPVTSPSALTPHWLDLAALFAIAGLTTAFCAFVQRGQLLVAERDPFFPEGLRYASTT